MALSKPTSPPKQRLPPSDHAWASPALHRRHKQPAVGANTVFLGKEFDSLERLDGAPMLELPIDLRGAVDKQPARSALTEALRKMAAGGGAHGPQSLQSERPADSEDRCDSDSDESSGRRARRANDDGAEGSGSSGAVDEDESPTSTRSLPGWFV